MVTAEHTLGVLRFTRQKKASYVNHIMLTAPLLARLTADDISPLKPRDKKNFGNKI